MNRIERNSSEEENTKFNLNMLARLDKDIFTFVDKDENIKEFSVEGYFKSLKQKLPENKVIFNKIRTHVLEDDEMCERRAFTDNRKLRRI